MSLQRRVRPRVRLPPNRRCCVLCPRAPAKRRLFFHECSERPDRGAEMAVTLATRGASVWSVSIWRSTALPRMLLLLRLSPLSPPARVLPSCLLSLAVLLPSVLWRHQCQCSSSSSSHAVAAVSSSHLRAPPSCPLQLPTCPCNCCHLRRLWPQWQQQPQRHRSSRHNQTRQANAEQTALEREANTHAMQTLSLFFDRSPALTSDAMSFFDS